MTFLAILEYARKGIRAEKDRLLEVQGRALQGAGGHQGARKMADTLQEEIEELDVKEATINDLIEIFKR